MVAGATVTAGPAAAATPAPLSPSLVEQLASATGVPLPMMVHGATLADARRAVEATGMTTVTTFDQVGVVVALATPGQVEAARTQPGVTYLEGNQPIELFTNTSQEATRGREAAQHLVGANKQPLDGSGVSVAVIDTGVDPTHPAFAGGKVVRNLKSLCLEEASTDTGCVLTVPNNVDTDTLSVGGHGTHVNGIAAGNPVTLSDGTEVSGAAPGAKIVSLSTGAVLLIIGADAALNWVLENHEAPCGPAAGPAVCPPIKVVNNSYGPAGGGEFDPNSATVKLQRELAEEGVITVWAAGNGGGDGSESLTNPPGQDPTGGVLSVASYNDANTGGRDGTVSTFSSRGSAGDPSTWPDISAPGENITSACRPYLLVCSTGTDPRNGPSPLDIGTYNTISGTSMAAPHITGIVAQLFQAEPDATPAAVEDALKSTAYRYDDGADYESVDGYSTSFDKGTGLVDVVEAVAALGASAD
ncbi:MAG: S8 family serine peptidase [Pseudonocardiaceae bacterium]|nr:S8 family serine peptidase [Pseudonocardiaceae bacterium]